MVYRTFLVLVLTAVSSAQADNWPHWRGTTRKLYCVGKPSQAAPTASAPQPPPRTSLPTPPESATDPSAFPVPGPANDSSPLGRGIQRTMTLLATSTPQHRNHVLIVFYGQSITEQEWSKQVADDLRRRFPHADLEIENRAIGGFASQMLIRPAEHDIYP